jgi:hypothetical protein
MVCSRRCSLSSFDGLGLWGGGDEPGDLAALLLYRSLVLQGLDGAALLSVVPGPRKLAHGRIIGRNRDRLSQQSAGSATIHAVGPFAGGWRKIERVSRRASRSNQHSYQSAFTMSSRPANQLINRQCNPVDGLMSPRLKRCFPMQSPQDISADQV